MPQHEAHPEVLSASSLIGDVVRNSKGEKLGKLEEIMIDLDEGRVAYAVLSFGGILGIGDKLFAIPWEALVVDIHDKEIIFDIQKDVLEKAPGFDKDNWPQSLERTWLVEVYTYYGYDPYF